MEPKDRIINFHPDPLLKTARKRPFSWIRSILLSLLILALVSIIAILIGSNKKRPADWVYINAIKSNQDIHLPDGSKVILRKGSHLHYPSDFGKKKRNVYLTGEAYFNIGKSEHPFLVETKNGTTSGGICSFLLSTIDSCEHLLVMNGSVNFKSSRKNGPMILLNQGEKADIMGSKYNRGVLDGQNYLSWKDQRLVFNHIPLGKVANDLSSHYGVPVRLASEMNGNEILVTGQFQNESLEAVLLKIATLCHVTVRKDHDTIWISDPLQSASKGLNTDKNKKTVQNQATAPAETTPPAKKKKKKWWLFWKKSGSD